MSEGDFLYCLINELLDAEEELEKFCPSCRAEAEKKRCPACGRPAQLSAVNPNFDIERFESLKRGGA